MKMENMWVFPKMMVPPNHPMFNRVFQYFHHPFWGTSIFGNTHVQVKNSVDDLIFVYIYVTMMNNPTVESNKKYMNLHRRLPESNKILVLAMQIDFFIS